MLFNKPSSVYHDQTAPKEQSDQGLHCLQWHLCPITYSRCAMLQYIAASDLEMDTLREDPRRYHEAWHQLVSAK